MASGNSTTSAKRLKIGFDAMNLALDRGTGVATYTRNVVATAKSLGHETSLLYAIPRGIPKTSLEREVVLFDTPAASGAVIKSLAVSIGDAFRDWSGVRATEIPVTGAVRTRQLAARYVPTDHVYAARELFQRASVTFGLTGRFMPVTLPEPVDVFHWTYPIPARVVGAANIYTVHDIIPVRLPYTTLDRKTYYIRLMRRLIREADHIVTVSENSQKDVSSFFGAEDHAITNTYQTVDIPAAVQAMSEDDLRQTLKGSFDVERGSYLLFFGSIEPKKNLGRVVDAFMGADVSMPLIIVAAQAWGSEREFARAQREAESERGRILIQEYLPWLSLATLIRGARAVLFPSLYEGFGLPALEAMTLGTPVVTSNQSSIPEIVGDAALTVDPYDTMALRHAIKRIATDDDLHRDLSAAGLVQARKFSAEVYRSRLDALYSKVADAGRATAGSSAKHHNAQAGIAPNSGGVGTRHGEK